MSVELIGARLMAPYYGNSLYVLTSILGITMSALLIGYFLGGRIVKESKNNNLFPYLFLFFSCIYLCLFPLLSSVGLELTLGLGLIGGTLLGTIILIAIPLILCGAISPMLIQNLNELGLKAGESSGFLFSISTLGGVFFTFLVGLLLIPTLGVKSTIILIGLSIGLVSFAFLIWKKRNIKVFFLTIFLIVAGISANSTDIQPFQSYNSCLYKSDGLLGSLSVCDFNDQSRILSCNGTDQSKMRIYDGLSMMMYTHVVSSIASLVPKNQRKNAMLVGLAGGAVVKELKELGFQNVRAVDIDKRTYDVSTKYFDLNENSFEFIEDDGRHYLNCIQDKFDVIIIDASTSEDQPWHLYTVEAIKLYKKHLSEDGLLIFNLIDDFSNGKGKIVDRVANGMDHNNLSPRLIYEFYPLDKMDKGSIATWIHERILVGSPNGFYKISSDLNDLTQCCKGVSFCRSLKNDLMSNSYDFKRTSTKVFKDDVPEMEKINFERIKKLRNRDFINL